MVCTFSNYSCENNKKQPATVTETLNLSLFTGHWTGPERRVNSNTYEKPVVVSTFTSQKVFLEFKQFMYGEHKG